MIDELFEMYSNIGPGNALGLGNIGAFTTTSYYWSSSEDNSNKGWQQFFDSSSGGYQSSLNKYNQYTVRAVRAF